MSTNIQLADVSATGQHENACNVGGQSQLPQTGYKTPSIACRRCRLRSQTIAE
jgi:hypothetical protein